MVSRPGRKVSTEGTFINDSNFASWQSEMKLTSLHDFFSSWHLYICRSLFVFSKCLLLKRQKINRKDVVYLHCRRFYNDMGLVPKFRNGKRSWRKLEMQNTLLKPEMTGYLCFSPRRILRHPRYSLTFGFPWTHPSVHSPWYQWHNCSSNTTLLQALFEIENTSNRQGLLRCTCHFLFRTRFL